MANPMQQFEVKTIGPKIEIGNFDVSFTNASLFMVITVAFISIFFVLATQKKSLVPSRLQLLSEMAYEFVAKMISETAGSKARPYFPFILTLFLFVLFCNMIGMIPYSFTVTSHIIVTFASNFYFYRGYNYWICQTWFWVSKTICSIWSTSGFNANNSNY